MAVFSHWSARFTSLVVSTWLLTSSGFAAGGDVVVQSGDSLWSLAKKHGVSVAALQAANEMGSSEHIRAGQTLRLPVTAKRPSGDPQSAPVIADTNKPQPKNTPVRPPESDSKLAKNTSRQIAVKPSPATPISAQTRQSAEALYSKDAPVAASNTLAERTPAWVLAEPGVETQGEKPSAARSGVFPCAAPDPGFAHYAKWVQVAPMAHVLAPPASPNLSSVRPDGGFDVVFHFHGREPIRKEWVRAMEGSASDAVLVAVDIGIASEPYRETFRDPRTFSQVLLAVENELQRRSGNPRAFAQNITLSSWSAGYGAIEQLLSQPIPRVRVGSVVLLDGLHAGFRDSGLDAERMAPFVEFAQRAATGSRLLFVSHSSIRTSSYASTTQTARYLIWKMGGRPEATASMTADPMGLERYTTFTRGNFHVRGFAGSGAADHCAHLGLMRDVLNVHLQPFWQRTRAAVAPDAAIAHRSP